MSRNGEPSCFGLSDIGCERATNEDQFLIADLSKSMVVHHTSLDIPDETQLSGSTAGQLMLVADGMGGAAAGERASQLTVDTIARHVLNTMPWFLRLHHQHEGELLDELKLAVAKCETVVEADVDEHPDRRGMGTTLTMAYVIWPRMYTVHVGDSRCSVLRGSRLEQITRDHTIAQVLEEEGVLPAQSGRSEFSHILVNSIGHGQERLVPEVYKTDLQVGDTILLCTDGLYGELSEEQIINTINSNTSVEQACRALIDRAKAAGGSDNITAIVSRY